jgi:hypothetical protein
MTGRLISFHLFVGVLNYLQRCELARMSKTSPAFLDSFTLTHYLIARTRGVSAQSGPVVLRVAHLPSHHREITHIDEWQGSFPLSWILHPHQITPWVFFIYVSDPSLFPMGLRVQTTSVGFFLSSLLILPQPPRQCLGPIYTCHLSSLN